AVSDTHDYLVEPPAEVAGHHSTAHTDDARDDDCAHADHDRNTCTPDNTTEQVAAELIGPERMRPGSICVPRRREQSTDEILVEGIREGQKRRGGGGADQHEQDRQCD